MCFCSRAERATQKHLWQITHLFVAIIRSGLIMLLAIYMMETGCQSQECARAVDHSTQLLPHLYHHHHHWCLVNTYSTLRKFKTCKLLLLFISFLVEKNNKNLLCWLKYTANFAKVFLLILNGMHPRQTRKSGVMCVTGLVLFEWF